MVDAQEPDFRLYLQSEFVRRRKSNQKYSLRSFARNLRVSPSALSAMLSGKRPITERMVIRLGLALGMNPSDLSRFKDASQWDGRRLEFNRVTMDRYAVMADWFHYAILELTRTRGFKPNSRWVSKRLGITATEVNIAVERLQVLGLLKITRDGRWIDASGEFLTNIDGNLTSEANRLHQKQLLEKSLAALQELSADIRNHTSITMAIDPALMPHAVERIKTFRRTLCAELEKLSKKQGGPAEVYNLSLSLFPLSHSSQPLGADPS